MQNSMFIILASFAFGILITLVIRMLVFERNHISKMKFESITSLLQTISLEKGVLEASHNELKKTELKIHSDLREKISELNVEKQANTQRSPVVPAEPPARSPALGLAARWHVPTDG